MACTWLVIMALSCTVFLEQPVLLVGQPSCYICDTGEKLDVPEDAYLIPPKSLGRPECASNDPEVLKNPSADPAFICRDLV